MTSDWLLSLSEACSLVLSSRPSQCWIGFLSLVV